MKILYRISNNSYKHKNKPVYLTKEATFTHFYNIFKQPDIYVVADNVNDELYNFLLTFSEKVTLLRTNLSNAGAFMYSVNYAIDNFNDSDIVYFAEDDYIYKQNACKLVEGLEIADYCTGYDHPDLYNYESCKLKCTNSFIWRYGKSTTMTFAVKVKTIKEDLHVYKKHCSGSHPEDYHMFLELTRNGRTLVNPLPGLSTHGEIGYFSPCVDWETEFYKM
jgi:hypothetical protein